MVKSLPREVRVVIGACLLVKGTEVMKGLAGLVSKEPRRTDGSGLCQKNGYGRIEYLLSKERRTLINNRYNLIKIHYQRAR